MRALVTRPGADGTALAETLGEKGIDSIIDRRTGKRQMGFDTKNTQGSKKRNLGESLREMSTEDLTHFGLIPEFVGRLPVNVSLNEMREEDLVVILQEPKNALIKQYQKLFKFEKVKLHFTDDAVRAIAEQAQERKSGARGLRAIIEKVMLDVMYEVPSIEGVSEVIITDGVVRGEEEPEFQSDAELGDVA